MRDLAGRSGVVYGILVSLRNVKLFGALSELSSSDDLNRLPPIISDMILMTLTIHKAISLRKVTKHSDEWKGTRIYEALMRDQVMYFILCAERVFTTV
jgi:hypothetical protein